MPSAPTIDLCPFAQADRSDAVKILYDELSGFRKGLGDFVTCIRHPVAELAASQLGRA